MTLSTPGLIGAGVALLIAIVTYFGVTMTLQREWERVDRTQGQEQSMALDRQHRLIRTILLADILIFPAVGYYVGQMLKLD
jgi:hypothetical protein